MVVCIDVGRCALTLFNLYAPVLGPMPRPLFEKEAAEEERQPTAERVETEGRDVAVVEAPKWLLIVAEHAPPEALAAVVKSAAERGLLSLDERAAALEVALALYRRLKRRVLVGKSPRVVAPP